MTNSNKRVLVIGAGYAGLLATMRLVGKLRGTNTSISLVNATDTFVERLRLHQFAANQTEFHRSIPNLLQGTGVGFTQGHVSQVNPTQHSVTVQTKTGNVALEYDYLLYALGSTIERDRVPGVRDHCYVLTPGGTHSAQALRDELPKWNAQGGRLLVCGGGATGVEATAEFAAAYPNLQVQLVTRGEFGAFLGGTVATYMQKQLRGRGVDVRDHTTIAQVEEHAAVTAAGDTLPFDVCVWTGGFTVPALAREAGLAVNERGQILVDPYLRSVSHPDIFAIGDAAMPVQEPGVHVRMSAYTAVIMGAHGADTLAAAVQGKTPNPLSFIYIGQAIALGPKDAIGFATLPADNPRAPFFTGRVGFEFREFFVRLLADFPGYEKRFPGSFFWFGKGRFAELQKRGTLNQLASASHTR